MKFLQVNNNATFFTKTFRKDVRLPVQLQRAMAAEAEAAREARAKASITIYIHTTKIIKQKFLKKHDINFFNCNAANFLS